MGLRERIEIVFSFLQFLALILTIEDVPFPTVDWGWLLDIFTVFDLFYWIPFTTDFKIQFVIVVVGIPQLVNFLILIGLNRKRVVVWYFSTLGFIAAFVAGAIFRLLGLIRGQETEADVTNGNFLLIAGGVGLAICIAAAVADFVFGDRRVLKRIEQHENGAQVAMQRNQDQVVEDFEADQSDLLTKEEELQREAQKPHYCSTIIRTVILVFFLIMGLLLTGLLSKKARDAVLAGSGMQDLAGVLGILCLVIAGLTLIWLVIGLFPKGRLMQLQFGSFCEVNLMRVCLIFLSLVYIPIVGRIVMVLNCNTFECGIGTMQTPAISMVVSNVTSNRVAGGCQVCTPSDQCSGADFYSTCPFERSSKLEYARYIPCQDMMTYFFPAAGLMLLAFALGLPMAFMKLTSVSANMLAAKFPVLMMEVDSNKLSDGDIWAVKVNQSTNITKFLYQSFQFRWKQWRLLLLFHKLVIVATTLYILRFDSFTETNYVPIVAATVVHSIVTIIVWRSKPFIHRTEDNVYRVMHICLALTATAGFLAIFGIYTIPSWLAITLLVLNLVLPLLALAVTLYFTSRDVKIETEHEKATGTVIQPGRMLPPQAEGSEVTPTRAVQVSPPVVVNNARSSVTGPIDAQEKKRLVRRKRSSASSGTTPSAAVPSATNPLSGPPAGAGITHPGPVVSASGGDSITIVRQRTPPVCGGNFRTTPSSTSDDDDDSGSSSSSSDEDSEHQEGDEEDTSHSDFNGGDMTIESAVFDSSDANNLSTTPAKEARGQGQDGESSVGDTLHITDVTASTTMEDRSFSLAPTNTTIGASPLNNISCDDGVNDISNVSSVHHGDVTHDVSESALELDATTAPEEEEAAVPWSLLDELLGSTKPVIDENQVPSSILTFNHTETYLFAAETNDVQRSQVPAYSTEEMEGQTIFGADGRILGSTPPPQDEGGGLNSGMNATLPPRPSSSAASRPSMSDRQSTVCRRVGCIEGATAVQRFDDKDQPVVVITKEDLNQMAMMDEYQRKKEIERRYSIAQAEIDRQIDDASLYIVRKYFMVCGAIGFLALGLCILGVVETGTVVHPITLATGSDPTTFTAHSEFVGYNNWTAFTDNCCCMPYYNDFVGGSSSTVLAVERWKCKNGWTKERSRSERLSSGAASTCARRSASDREEVALRSPDCALTAVDTVRPMCSATFLNGCAVDSDGQLHGCAAAVPDADKHMW